MMGKYKYILFDMDGTLVNSAPGIFKAVQYTQAKLHLPILNERMLQSFLGPPLTISFQTLYGMDEDAASVAASVFREYYSLYGILQCDLYPGVCDTLAVLKQRGYFLYIATSKPTLYARQIAEKLGICAYFVDIVGSNMNNTRSSKQEVIQYILDCLSPIKLESCLMIGDKSHDIVGAAACGIDSMGVSYGFGSDDELIKAGPLYVIDRIDILQEVL